MCNKEQHPRARERGITPGEYTADSWIGSDAYDDPDGPFVQIQDPRPTMSGKPIPVRWNPSGISTPGGIETMAVAQIFAEAGNVMNRTGYSPEELLTRLEKAMNEVESLGVENMHLCDQKRDLIVQNENLHRDRLALDLKVRKQELELGRLRTLLAEAGSMVLSISRTSDDPTHVSWADELLHKIKSTI